MTRRAFSMLGFILLWSMWIPVNCAGVELVFVFPSFWAPGGELEVQIEAFSDFSRLKTESPSVSFGPGVSVMSGRLVSKARIKARISIDGSAELGLRVVKIFDGSGNLAMVGIFRVIPEDQVISLLQERLKRLARAMAASLAEPTVTSLLREELKRHVEDLTFQFESVSEVLSSALARVAGLKSWEISDMALSIPGLQIAMPVGYKAWDFAWGLALELELKPMAVPVAYIPLVADESQVKSISAFVFDGKEVKEIQLDVQVPPDTPVIVLGIAETSDVQEPKDPPGVPVLYLQRMTVRNKSEPWWAGPPEIYVKFGNNKLKDEELNLEKYFRQENRWYDLNMRLFPWYKDYGDFTYFAVWERDFSIVRKPVKIQIQCPLGIKAEMEIMVGFFDDDLGARSANRKDFKSDLQCKWSYDTGAAQFELMLRGCL